MNTTVAANCRPKKKTGIKSRSETIFTVVNYTILSIAALVTLIPLINILMQAFSTHSVKVLFWPVKFDTFAFRTVLSEAKFWSALGITIAITVGGTALSVLCMSMSAYALSKKYLPFRRAVIVFFFIAMLFSGGMVPNYILMSSLKLTDTLFALILPSSVQVFHLILMKNFFEGIPEALEESARIDGANNFRILFSIVFPISMSMIVTVSLFTAVVYWNNYFNALLYISAAKSHLYPLSYYIINVNEQFRDPQAPITLGEKFKYEQNIKSATIILSMLRIVCTYPFFLKYFTKGVTVGSVKG